MAINANAVRFYCLFWEDAFFELSLVGSVSATVIGALRRGMRQTCKNIYRYTAVNWLGYRECFSKMRPQRIKVQSTSSYSIDQVFSENMLCNCVKCAVNTLLSYSIMIHESFYISMRLTE